MLKIAMPYWAAKPSEYAMYLAVAMVTNSPFRIANYFDFRMQEGVTCLTEALEDFDPWAIDFPAAGVLGDAGEFLSSQRFDLTDFLHPSTGLGKFEERHEFRYLVIEEDLTDSDNAQIYEIDYLEEMTTSGYIKGTFPNAHAGQYRWRLTGYQDDYVSEVRVVDRETGELTYTGNTVSFSTGETIYGTSSGAKAVIVLDDNAGDEGRLYLRNLKGRFVENEGITGLSGGTATAQKLTEVLNRDLLTFLLGEKTTKPASERVDVIYIAFLDQFLLTADLGQWTTSDVTVPSPGGYAQIADGGEMYHVPASGETVWGDQVAVFKIEAQESATVARVEVFRDSSGNAYAVEINYSTKLVSLKKNTTTLASTTLSYLKVAYPDTIRAELSVDTSGDTHIRIKINGEQEFAYTDAGGYTDGGIGASTTGGALRLSHAEVMILPVELDRVGPNP
jgi:hypothetical protein